MQQHNRMRPSERKSEAPSQAQQHQTSERHSVDQRRSSPHGDFRRESNDRERQRVNCENDLYERGSI
jgi:hypothetical protein